MSAERLGRRLQTIRKELDALSAKGEMGARWEALYEEESRIFSVFADRNLKRKELERQGDIEGAIQLYEQNVADEADTPALYRRLAVIYRKHERLDDEIRVLGNAIAVFGKLGANVSDWQVQLAKAREKQHKHRGSNEKS